MLLYIKPFRCPIHLPSPSRSNALDRGGDCKKRIAPSPRRSESELVRQRPFESNQDACVRQNSKAWHSSMQIHEDRTATCCEITKSPSTVTVANHGDTSLA